MCNVPYPPEGYNAGVLLATRSPPAFIWCAVLLFVAADYGHTHQPCAPPSPPAAHTQLFVLVRSFPALSKTTSQLLCLLSLAECLLA